MRSTSWLYITAGSPKACPFLTTLLISGIVHMLVDFLQCI